MKFEKGIGGLLKNAWMHVEALQTTDLPLLITHVAAVLAAAVATPVSPRWRLACLVAACGITVRWRARLAAAALVHLITPNPTPHVHIGCVRFPFCV